MYSPSRVFYDYKSDSTTTALLRMATVDALNAYAYGLITWQEFNSFVADITTYVAVYVYYIQTY